MQYDEKLEDLQDAISPLPSLCALTKQGSSEVDAANSTDTSKRQALLSFGKSSNAPSYSQVGSDLKNSNFSGLACLNS